MCYQVGSKYTELYIPANTSAAHLDGDLPRLQPLSALNILDRRRGFSNPEVVVGVGEDPDVGLVDNSSSSHDGESVNRERVSNRE